MALKAFIFGSNYKNTSAQLNACVRDCERINEALSAKGYQITKKWSEGPLDKTDINTSLLEFLKSLKTRDKAIIYYSGHGFQIVDTNRDETDGRDECIYLSNAGYFSDDEFRSMISVVPSGINILCLFDCCHSGTIFDLPFQFKELIIQRINKTYFNANIICISGCPDDKVSYEANGTGFLTDSFLAVLDAWKPIFCSRFPWIDFYIFVTGRLFLHSKATQISQLTFSNSNCLKSFWI